MAKAVFTHRAGSVYDDEPEKHYHFPETYFRQVERTVGDWIVYYEPRRDNGRMVYFAVAKVASIRRDERRPGQFYALVSDYLDFPRPVPVRNGGGYFEERLRKEDGSPNRGLFGRSVRSISEADFDNILAAGLTTDPAELGLEQAAETVDGFQEDQEVFERRIVEQLSSRKFRDAAFARNVKLAYKNVCAISGLALRNGGGRPEVQAAHIRPVADNGPDTVRNGIALSGTIHWMFDRGLISIDDDHSVLVASNKLPDAAISRLILPDRKLILPENQLSRPHPAYLRYHREHVFAA